MKSFDVITIGSATQDVFVRSKSLEEQRDPTAPDGIDACIPMGSKLPIDELTLATGGGATNAAVTFSRFGLKTACVSRIGDDVTGDMIMAELKREGVNASLIKRAKGEMSAYSVILLAGSGHRGILTHRGASSKLDVKDLPRGVRADWLYCTSFGGNAKLLKAAFDLAERIDARIAWNPGEHELALGWRALLPLMKRADVLMLNKEEAAELADMPPRDVEGVMNKIGAAVDGTLVVTDGERGAHALGGGRTWRVGTLKGKRVNTTGAGDAFGSALVAGLALGKPLQNALQAAALNAHGVITHMGAKAGILRGFPGAVALRKVPIKPL